MTNRSRVRPGVPTGGQFSTSSRPEAPLSPLCAALEHPRVEFTFAETSTPGVYIGMSDSGWGSRAAIATAGLSGETQCRWVVRQGGWEWDGVSATVEDAMAAASTEANLMLYRQEKEEDGFDWDAVDYYPAWVDEAVS